MAKSFKREPGLAYLLLDIGEICDDNHLDEGGRQLEVQVEGDVCKAVQQCADTRDLWTEESREQAGSTWVVRCPECQTRSLMHVSSTVALE